MTIHAFRPLGPSALLRATAPRLSAMQNAAAVFATFLNQRAPTFASNTALARDILDALATAGPLADSPDLDCDALGDLALRLRARGLTLRGYIALQAAFLDTLSECLGSEPALHAAWRRALSTILATMMTAAHGPRRMTGPLAA
jgi:hypothetical protein